MFLDFFPGIFSSKSKMIMAFLNRTSFLLDTYSFSPTELMRRLELMAKEGEGQLLREVKPCGNPGWSCKRISISGKDYDLYEQ